MAKLAGLVLGLVAFLSVGAVLSAAPASADCTPLGGLVTSCPPPTTLPPPTTVPPPPVPAPAPAPSPSPAPSSASPTVNRDGAAHLLGLINADRMNAGLAPLAASDSIRPVAEEWSATMAKAGQISHDDAYFTMHDRFDAARLGENVACNTSIDDAHARLMASPGHHANIMDPGFRVVGIGVVRIGDGQWFITEDFAQPRVHAAPAAPVRSEVARSAPAAPRLQPPVVGLAPVSPTTTSSAPPGAAPLVAFVHPELAHLPAPGGARLWPVIAAFLLLVAAAAGTSRRLRGGKIAGSEGID